MSMHPNMQRVQIVWDGVATGDYAAFADITAPHVAMVHGPGAGPFAGPGRGSDRLGEMALFFNELFGGTFHQTGQCVYADDDCAVVLARETGTTADGAVFDNRALWISRFDNNRKVDGIWTIDLDDTAVRQFWANRQREAIR